MVSAAADLLWLAGAAASLGLLAYGAFLVWRFSCAASAGVQRTVARLALHDSFRGIELDDLGHVLRP